MNVCPKRELAHCLLKITKNNEIPEYCLEDLFNEIIDDCENSCDSVVPFEAKIIKRRLSSLEGPQRLIQKSLIILRETLIDEVCKEILSDFSEKYASSVLESKNFLPHTIALDDEDKIDDFSLVVMEKAQSMRIDFIPVIVDIILDIIKDGGHRIFGFIDENKQGLLSFKEDTLRQAKIPVKEETSLPLGEEKSEEEMIDDNANQACQIQ
jgi:hypothetical protein